MPCFEFCRKKEALPSPRERAWAGGLAGDGDCPALVCPSPPRGPGLWQGTAEQAVRLREAPSHQEHRGCWALGGGPHTNCTNEGSYP